MKVLMVGPYPMQPGKVVGGVEAVVSTLAPALADLDAIEHLYVLSFSRGQHPWPARVTSGKLTVIYVAHFGILANATSFLVDRVRARRIANRLQPDLVHGQGLSQEGFVAIKMGFPTVLTVHGVSSVEARLRRTGPKSHIAAWLIERRMIWNLQHADAVISTSQYDAGIVSPFVCGKHVRMANPIDRGFYSSDTLTGGTESANPKSILHAATVLPRKNQLGLLSAFRDVVAKVPDARLVLVGPILDESYAALCRARIVELGLGDRVQFLGHVPEEILKQQLRMCAFLVLFSREETLPTIIAQAMCSGKAVIASRVGGVPELVTDGETGWLVPPGDEAALANKMVDLLTMPETARRMGMQAAELAHERFEPSAIARATAGLYSQVLACRAASRNTTVKRAEQ